MTRPKTTTKTMAEKNVFQKKKRNRTKKIIKDPRPVLVVCTYMSTACVCVYTQKQGEVFYFIHSHILPLATIKP